MSEQQKHAERDIPFVNCTKVSHKVQHKELGKLGDLCRRDIQIMCYLYWEQTACIHIENKFSE